MILFILLLLISSPVDAQSTAIDVVPAWDSHRNIADTISYVTLGASLAIETYDAFKSTDKKQALIKEGERIGTTILIAEITKRIVHRTRPDGSDRKSFFSEHTALSATANSARFKVTIPLSSGTGYLRIAADKHFLTDTIVGFLVGSATAMVFKQ